jgi:hypothetical protein
MARGAEIGLVKKQEPPAPTVRIRYNKRLGILLRTFEELAIIQLDLDQTISYVKKIEIEKI